MKELNIERKPTQKRILGLIGAALRVKWFQLFLIALVLGIIVYIINDGFLSRGNIRNLMRGMVVPGLMIVAVGPLLAGGGIDLAAAGQATLGSVFFANLMVFFPGMPWGVAAIITMVLGAVFGIINVFFVNKMNFSAFIVTIAMGMLYQGLTQAWTGFAEVPIWRDSLIELGRLSVFNEWVPVLFIVVLLIVAAYVFMMAKTKFGRSIYMTGGNEAATRLAGINPKKVRGILFVNSGIMATLAGVAWSSQNRLAHPTSIVTNAPNFTALTAVIIGGVSFRGGSGSLAAGFFGLVVVRLFENGLMMAGFRTYVNVAAQGVILVVALIGDHISVVRQRQALIKASMEITVSKAEKP